MDHNPRNDALGYRTIRRIQNKWVMVISSGCLLYKISLPTMTNAKVYRFGLPLIPTSLISLRNISAACYLRAFGLIYTRLTLRILCLYLSTFTLLLSWWKILCAILISAWFERIYSPRKKPLWLLIRGVCGNLSKVKILFIYFYE